MTSRIRVLTHNNHQLRKLDTSEKDHISFVVCMSHIFKNTSEGSAMYNEDCS